MARIGTLGGVAAVIVALGACAAPDPYQSREVPLGEQLDIRHILGAHPNKRACVDYEAATNSCTSLGTLTVEGNILISRAMTALQVAGSTSVQNIETVTRSTLEGEWACVRAQDISVTGRDEMSEFTLETTRDQIMQAGGTVCTTYYRSGDGYLARSLGAEGQSVPPGDLQFQFIPGAAGLRAQ